MLRFWILQVRLWISCRSINDSLLKSKLFAMFVCSSHSRILHSCGDVTFAGFTFRPMLTLMAIEQYGFFSVSHLLCDTRTPDTHTSCRTLSCGAVTTCINELSLSWSEIEPRSCACEANVLPLSHRGVKLFAMRTKIESIKQNKIMMMLPSKTGAKIQYVNGM